MPSEWLSAASKPDPSVDSTQQSERTARMSHDEAVLDRLDAEQHDYRIQTLTSINRVLANYRRPAEPMSVTVGRIAVLAHVSEMAAADLGLLLELLTDLGCQPGEPL